MSVVFAQTCHLNVFFENNELMRQRYQVWDHFFSTANKNMQKSSGVGVSFIPISQKEAFCVFSTGRDLFLGVFDEGKKKIGNVVGLESVLYLNASRINKLFTLLCDKEKSGIISNINPEYASVLGEYIPRVRLEESVLSRLPRGVGVSRDVDNPFVIDIRKAPPFNEKDFVFRFNFNNNRVGCLIDGCETSLESLKEKHDRVYNLFSSLSAVSRGDDLSRVSAKALLDNPYRNNDITR